MADKINISHSVKETEDKILYKNALKLLGI